MAQAQREHAQVLAQPGWVEHDATEIWRNTQAVIADALRAAGLKGADLAAIGITNQRETVVAWDRATGAPVHHALVWQDTRVADDVARHEQEHGVALLRDRTGLPPSTYFSAFKLRWLLDHVPGLRARARAGDVLFGTVDSWLVWQLTGGPDGGRHVTDVTNASRTQLMNLRTLQWDADLLALFDVPAATLAEIRSSSERYGAAAIEPVRGVPISGILGDQQAALVGQACFEPGSAKNTYGTGCFLLLHTGATPVASTSGLLTTVAYRFGDAAPCYALEGSVAVTGALVQWLRDNLGLFERSADVEALARSVPDNGGVYVVPAFSGLFAPYWNPRARGTIVGLTQFATRGHIARAALEATAFQTADVLDAMERDCGTRLATLRVDGGMTDDDLLMQFQADIIGRPVVRAAVRETTALGAAYAAGLGAGVFRNLDALRALWQAGREWTPAMPDASRVAARAAWSRAVSRALDWVPG